MKILILAILTLASVLVQGQNVLFRICAKGSKTVTLLLQIYTKNSPPLLPI
jgi:hypothetical protein